MAVQELLIIQVLLVVRHGIIVVFIRFNNTGNANKFHVAKHGFNNADTFSSNNSVNLKRMHMILVLFVG